MTMNKTEDGWGTDSKVEGVKHKGEEARALVTEYIVDMFENMEGYGVHDDDVHQDLRNELIEKRLVGATDDLDDEALLNDPEIRAAMLDFISRTVNSLTYMSEDED